MLLRPCVPGVRRQRGKAYRRRSRGRRRRSRRAAAPPAFKRRRAGATGPPMPPATAAEMAAAERAAAAAEGNSSPGLSRLTPGLRPGACAKEPPMRRLWLVVAAALALPHPVRAEDPPSAEDADRSPQIAMPRLLSEAEATCLRFSPDHKVL